MHDFVPSTEWVFFTSKNAVRFFFKSQTLPEGTKVGCAGIGTRKILANFVDEIHFTGDHVDIQKVGSEFADIVGDATCLFPISNISRRTIQAYFENQNKAIDFIVYNTEGVKEVSEAKEDILVFTSPSNVDQYFSKHGLKPYQKVIAMGSSTGIALQKNGVSKYLLPQLPGEFGIVDLLHSLI